MKITSKQTGIPSAQMAPGSELIYLAASSAVPPSIQQSSSTFPVREDLAMSVYFHTSALIE